MLRVLQVSLSILALALGFWATTEGVQKLRDMTESRKSRIVTEYVYDLTRIVRIDKATGKVEQWACPYSAFTAEERIAYEQETVGPPRAYSDFGQFAGLALHEATKQHLLPRCGWYDPSILSIDYRNIGK